MTHLLDTDTCSGHMRRPGGLAGLFGKYRDDPTLREICEDAYQERDAELRQ